MLETLELGSGRSEQGFAGVDMLVHGAADIEEQQHLDRIVPFRAQADIEHAAFARGGRDRAVEIEFLGRAFAGEAAQAAQRDLEIARTEFGVAVEVAVDALLPDLGGHAAAALRADPDAARVVPAGAERAGAAGADPAVAAAVAFLLLLEALAEFLHQFLEAAEGLDLRLFLIAEQALHAFAQPVLGDRRELLGQDRVDSVEVVAEGAIEAVEMAFVLDQDRAREAMQGFAIGKRKVGLQCCHEVEPFAQGHRHAGAAQGLEQADQHGAISSGSGAGA